MRYIVECTLLDIEQKTFALWGITEQGEFCSPTLLAEHYALPLAPQEITLALPVDNTGQLVLPPIVHPASHPIDRLQEFSIPAVRIHYQQLQLLTCLSAMPGLIGNSFRWWQTFINTLHTLISHHWVIPTMHQQEGQYLTITWQLLLPMAQASYMEQLIHAFPGYATSTPLTHTAIQELYNDWTDAIVRERFANTLLEPANLTPLEQKVIYALQKNSVQQATPALTLLSQELAHWHDYVQEQLIVRSERQWRCTILLTHGQQGWMVTLALQWLPDPCCTITMQQLPTFLASLSATNPPVGNLPTWAHTLPDELPVIVQQCTLVQKKFPWLTTTPEQSISVKQVQELLTYHQKFSEQIISLLHPPIRYKRLELILQTALQGTLGVNAILSYKWQAAIDQQPLTSQEFAQLVEAQEGYLEQDGTFIFIPSQELQQAQQHLQEQERQIQMIELVRMAITKQLYGIPIARLDLPPAVHTVLEQLSEHRAVLAPSAVLPNITLRPYQQAGYQWLYQLRQLQFGALLADDMGLGKTIQVLALLAAIQNQQHGPWLIICPVSVMHVWQTHITKLLPSLSVCVLQGTEDITHIQDDVVITTYATVTRNSSLSTITWDTIIADEAQAIKNPTAKQTKAVKRLHTTHRIALTGTPIENKLEELWSIMNFCNRGYLGTLAQFQQDYVQPITLHADAQATNQLQQLLAPFMLRRTKQDPLVAQELPHKQEFTISCTLNAHQAALYQQVVNSLLSHLHTEAYGQKSNSILRTITRLKQICNDPALVTHSKELDPTSGKLVQLLPLLHSLQQEQRKVVVFTQFASYATLLADYLTAHDMPALVMTGKNSAQERQELLQTFAGTTHNILIASLKTGGVGLTITCATAVIHMDRWWNPAVEQQATDRTYRIGQERDVQIYTLQTVGTIEEKIEQLLRKKQQLVHTVQGAYQNKLSQLSLQELTELLTLH